MTENYVADWNVGKLHEPAQHKTDQIDEPMNMAKPMEGTKAIGPMIHA